MSADALSMSAKIDQYELGAVATGSKSSRGTGVVWMETTLERLDLTPSHEEWRPPQGDPTKQQLYQGAEKMPEEHKPERFALN